MNRAGDRVVVIGGGLIGTLSAYYLAERGFRVTLLEKKSIGAGASSGNCGLVCPSHVLPLAEPGAVTTALGSLLKPDSPLAVKPRFDPALWAWLASFARRCNGRDMLAAGRAIAPLLASSLRLYKELVPKERLACEFATRGLLYVYQRKDAFESYAETDALLSREFGTPARRIEGSDLEGFEPALRAGLAGGWYYEDDSQTRPDLLLVEMRERLAARGVEILEGRKAEGFKETGRRAEAVATGSEEVAGDMFVVAAGAWTPRLARALSARIPIQPGKGYSLTMPRPKPCPAHPVIFPETRVAATPFETCYRLGSTMEFAGYDESLPTARLELLKAGARPYLKDPHPEPVEQSWYGWRPMTPDSVPIIDWSPALENVLIAAGHNMLGLSMAPATGKLVAELVAGAQPHLNVDAYRLARFGGRRKVWTTGTAPR